jgi:hypothetical protein
MTDLPMIDRGIKTADQVVQIAPGEKKTVPYTFDMADLATGESIASQVIAVERIDGGLVEITNTDDSFSGKVAQVTCSAADPADSTDYWVSCTITTDATPAQVLTCNALWQVRAA